MNQMPDILPIPDGADNPKKLSDEKLLAYLEGKLSPGEQHEVELWLGDKGMESDALDGLKTLAPGEIRRSVNQLNHNLRKASRKKNKRRNPLPTEQFTWVAIVIVLLLVAVAFFIIKKTM